MSWLSEHKKSERLASEAEIAVRKQQPELARRLYGAAAEHEAKALEGLDLHKPRSYGITAVSAVALYWKAGRQKEAVNLGRKCLESGRLPGFAYRMIRENIGAIEE